MSTTNIAVCTQCGHKEHGEKAATGFACVKCGDPAPIRGKAYAVGTFAAELTDTYGGEANYSWVRRAEFSLPIGASDRAIVKAGKAALQITGTRCMRSEYGDTIQLDVVGACMRAFIVAVE